MSLRPATDSDLPRLAALHAASFETPWTAEALAETLSGAGVTTVVVEEAGEAAGFLVARAAAGEAEVLTVAVDPTYRRRGLASRMLAAVLETVRGQGAEAIFLEVGADNPAAMALYAAHGFEQAGRRPGYYPRRDGRRVDALILRRDLTA